MKLKTLAVAVALGVAGQANAAIDSPSLGFDNLGGSELVLTVYDGADLSYTRDLGINWNDIAGFAGSFGPDAALSNMIATAENPLVWTLTAVDGNQQASSLDAADYGRGLIATSGLMNPSVTNLTNFGVGMGKMTSWVTALNTNATHSGEEDGASLVGAASQASWGVTNTGTGFSVTGSLGDSMTLYSFMETVTITGVNPFTGSATYAVNGVSTTALGTWSMGVDGTLSVAPVPVPAAVWLMGSALAGLVGLRRRKLA